MGPRATKAYGAVLVADACGFSRLAESAEADPVRGAEPIADLLQRRFESIVRRCEANGGLVVCFPGDAVLVFFPCTSATDAPEKRAIAAARELLDEADAFDGLRVRCGVAWGPLHVVEMGARSGGRPLVLLGAPVRDAFRLHSEAQDSEVRSRPSEASGADDEADFRDAGLAATFEFAQDAALRALVDDPTGFVAEQRRVTTVFVRLLHGEATNAHDFGPIDAAYAAVEDLVVGNGGVVVQCLADEVGLTVMACWGLPGNTFEDDVPRALAGATEIVATLAQLRVSCSLGVATGKVFTGPRGAHERFEYAPIGHAVNVAARLMQLGAAGVRVDEATANEAGPRWKVVPIDFRQLAKLEHPSRIFGLEPLTAPPPVEGAMYGRAFERAQIDDAIAAIGIRPNGPRLGYEAPPGMGKSALARYARAALESRSVRIVRIAGRERGSDAPEISLGSVFSDLPTFDLEAELTRALADQPRLVDWIPAFLSVLDPRARESELSRQMEPEQRRHAARRIFATLLERLSESRPCALLVDDAHGLDEATEDLVLHALRTVPSLGAFFFGRGEESGRGPWTARAPSVGILIHPLSGLDDEAVGAIVASLVGAERATPDVVRSIARRCGGNPLFVRHLALSMRDSISPSTTDPGDEVQPSMPSSPPVSLPPTIEATLSARIDRLPSPARHALKLASVLGREFDESILRAMDESTSGQLDRLGSRGILVRDPRTRRARFDHALTREVAYNLLLDSQRRELHGRAAGLFPGPNDAAIRAYHRVRSDSPWTAIGDLDDLGREATRRFANFEALAFLEQAEALETLHRAKLRLDFDEERLRATRRAALIAEAAHKVGRHETAMSVGRRAGAHVGVRFPEAPFRKFVSVASALATHLKARQFADGDPDELEASVDPRLRQAAASAFYWASLSAFNHNHVGSYVLFNVLTLNQTEHHADVRERALALAVMGITAGLGGLHGAAERYGRDAVALATSLRDDLALAHVRMFDSIRLGALGSFDALERSCAPSIPVADRYGDLRLAAELRSLRALGLGHRGELDTASRLWTEVLAISKESSDPTVENWARCGLVEAELRRDGPVRAAFCEEQLVAAAAASAALGAEESARAIGLTAWMHGRLRDRGEALTSIRLALDALDELGVPNAFWSLDGMSGPYLGLAALRARGMLGPGDEVELAERAADAVGRYARVFSLGAARKSLADAFVSDLKGRGLLARLETARARRTAAELGLDLELRLVLASTETT